MNNAESKSTLPLKNQDRYNAAIAKGLEVLAAGGSKADAARAIYEMIQDEERDVIVQAFIDGANVTVKGSPTYFYNVRRQFERKQREESKKAPAKSKKKAAEPAET